MIGAPNISSSGANQPQTTFKAKRPPVMWSIVVACTDATLRPAFVRRDLTDTVAVVTRYFGGVKLGAGGLVRAYGRAVSEAVDAIGTVGRARFATFAITVDHADAGRLENALHAAGHRVADIAYDSRATITVHVPEAETTPFHDWLASQTAGATTAEPGPPIDLDV